MIDIDFVFRPLASEHDYAACEALQREAWGRDFDELVTSALLKVSQKIGGVAAGAFDARGRLAGFVFGMTGIREGKTVHWSHMLAVSEEFRGHGLGKRLKMYQRDQLLALGVEEVYWTFDPLVARNAHLNLNLLGATVDDYVVNMYREGTSELHGGFGTDRFVVKWKIADERVQRILAGKEPEQAPVDGEVLSLVAAVARAGGILFPSLSPMKKAAALRIEIPPDIKTVSVQSLEAARSWREATRTAFTWSLQNGYRISTFQKDESTNRSAYLLLPSQAL